MEIPIDQAIDAQGDTLAVDPAGDTLLVELLYEPGQAPPIPAFSDADYLAAYLALMPRGRVWPTDPSAIQVMLLAGLAPTFTRVNGAAAALIADIFPSTTVDLLPEWEAALGLPDPCGGEAATIQARQAQVVQRFVNDGGQSAPYFVDLAQRLGYPITITEYTAPDDPHHWQVNAPTISEFYFRAGNSTVGEPLTSGGNAVLECVIRELKPAHTSVSFHYGT